jgi:hypothetical protein
MHELPPRNTRAGALGDVRRQANRGTRDYRSGEIFSVAAGELHDEWIEADGAQILVGRKFSKVAGSQPGA